MESPKVDIELFSDNYETVDFEKLKNEFGVKPVMDDNQRILKILDLEKLFYDASSQYGDRITILNTIDPNDPKYSDILKDKIFFNKTMLEAVPSCQCKNYEGLIYQDQICPLCNTPATLDVDIMEDNIMHKGWIEFPSFVEGKFIHPQIYKILSNWLTHKSRKERSPVTYLDYILNPNLECDIDALKPLLKKGRGFTYFYHHFDEIISYFAYVFPKTSSRVALKTRVLYLLALYRDRVFTKYLPILSSTLHAIISSGNDSKKKYVNNNCKDIITAISELAYLQYGLKYKSEKQINEIIFQAFTYYMDYQYDVTHKQLSNKPALPRMHIFASRLNFTSRSVIVPHSEMRKLDELVLPWSVSVELLKIHILGRLIRNGMDVMDALNKHFNASQCYDPDIDKIIHDLIEECPYKGLPCLFNRNPSIHNGSIQLLFIVGVKKNPKDNTCDMPLPITPAFNADYDGDEMNLYLFTEMDAVPYFKTLHPAYIMLGRNALEIRPTVSLAKPLLVTLNHFLGMV